MWCAGRVRIPLSAVLVGLVLAGCSEADPSTGEGAVVPAIEPATTSSFGPAATSSEPPTTSTSTTTTSTTTTTTTSTTTIDPSVIGTLPPIEGLGAPTLDRSSTVSTVGIDRVMFGMTVEEAQRAAGTRFTLVTPRDECFLATPDDAPTGITFWIVESTLERVDVDTPAITTRSGAGLGDSEARILELFGERIHTRPLADGSGNLLAYVPKDVSDRQFRVMFQTDGYRVVRLWSGRLPWAEWMAGCGSATQ